MERLLLRAAPMNHIFLGSKQFFLGTIRLTSRLLAKFGITPARYNMLYAILSGEGGVAQYKLRSLLGVSSPTISRMLKSLEKLGFVIRTPHPRNRRHRWVTATTSGLLRLRAATADIVEDTSLDAITEELVNPEPGNHRVGAETIAAADSFLTRVRERLGDAATLRFPYDGEYGDGSDWTTDGGIDADRPAGTDSRTDSDARYDDDTRPRSACLAYSPSLLRTSTAGTEARDAAARERHAAARAASTRRLRALGALTVQRFAGWATPSFQM